MFCLHACFIDISGLDLITDLYVASDKVNVSSEQRLRGFFDNGCE